MEDKKGLIVSGIKPLATSETVLKVKKEIAQVIVAMSSHGYLLLEGGETLVEFIVRNSSIDDEQIVKWNQDKVIIIIIIIISN